MIFAIDPGTTESGWVLYDEKSREVHNSGISANTEILSLPEIVEDDQTPIAIEMIASYGMAVGKEVFETCVWIGRFIQAAKTFNPDRDVRMIYRRDVKIQLCGSPRAKDANIRQALIDAIGPQGTKKAPGPTYGIRSHAWAALAVAYTASPLVERVEDVPGILVREEDVTV